MTFEDRLSSMDDQQTEYIAARIKEAREYLGLSQEFVSNKIGVPRTAFSAIEAGRRKVSGIELNKLAHLLMKPISYFFADGEILLETDQSPIKALYRTSKALSAEDQQQVLRFAEFLQAAHKANLNTTELEN